MERALLERKQGVSTGALVAKYKIPARTLTDRLKRARDGVELQKPGPPPKLGRNIEVDIRDWIIGIQQIGYPVTRETTLIKGKDAYSVIYGKTRASGIIGRGWLDRFLARYPELSARMAQAIKRQREDVQDAEVSSLFSRCAKVIIEHKLDASRCFNVDETAFVKQGKTKKVIVLKGSRNVWTKSIAANFHLTVVASAGANGFQIPPLYVLPGQRIDREILSGCEVIGARVTTVQAGFMNGDLFLGWLAHFAASVPSPVRRPIMLVLDGVSSHMSREVDELASELGVVLVQLPPNPSHLFQPLDVGVFMTVKRDMRREIERHMLNTGRTSLTKKDAIGITSRVWTNGATRCRQCVPACNCSRAMARNATVWRRRG